MSSACPKEHATQISDSDRSTKVAPTTLRCHCIIRNTDIQPRRFGQAKSAMLSERWLYQLPCASLLCHPVHLPKPLLNQPLPAADTQNLNR